MSWTAASFKVRYPEFGERADVSIDTTLAEASRRCAPAVFGDALDDAVGLLAAHLLSGSLYGQQANQAAAGMETAYLRDWRLLARARGGGPRVI